jgi:hypothetical protein
VRYVFRHLPLNDVHANAQTAAEAAEAAAAQGAFWEMHDVLLAHQDELRAGTSSATPRARARRRALRATRCARGVTPRASPRRRERRRERRLRHADVLRQRPRHHGAYDVATLTAAVRAAKLRARSAAGEFTAP